VHELAIAQSVVAIVDQHARGREVTRVWLRIGHLRQVVPSALEFAFELVSDGTAAEGAELRIEHVAATARCRACAHEAPLEAFPAVCAACRGLDVEVTGGDELLVESLEVEEPRAAEFAGATAAAPTGREGRNA
jgi:hydrogenase nickel incorporation protein HypA/HybF